MLRRSRIGPNWVGIGLLVAVALLCSSWTLAGEEPGLRDGDPELACELVKYEGALLLDVRAWWEYSLFRLPGARNIPVKELSKRLDEVYQAVEGKRDQPIVVYCTKGARAGEAKRILTAAGFSRITNLGGISDWKDCE